jgi:serine phosphatase RsbU (regulator of sigma subunit)
MSLGDIGDAYFIQKDYQKAILNFEKAFYIAEEIGALDQINRVSESLHKLYKTQKKWNKALHMHELFLESKDSLSNMDAKEELYRFEIEKEFELEKLADSLLFMQQMEVKSEQIKTQNEKIKREKSITYSLFLGMLIVSASLIIIFKNLKKTKKQKGIIEDQKAIVESANDELEEKNKEIMDSINYAKRIQLAILPPIKTVKKHFKESFILYKPKDIVAGDFYWMEKKNEKILFAAADCTGHGVPGAMVSVVCNNGLNRSVREHDLTVPGEILDKTREIIIEEFQKSEEDVKDGMDIALCSVTGMKLQYAGAYNPLWIIRNGEIIERKADKQPIGQFENTKPYTTHSFDLEKGDTIYIFSDGYVDQFGGERGKKFKGKAFRELLLSIQEKNMEDQKTTINKTFETWKGELEQIDDICIIGVRV